MTDWIDLFI